MNNLFNTSPEEKNRIRKLHESYKNVHGTTSLLNEQVTDRVLKGTLLDFATKEPLPGANIIVTDTQNGTTTDAQGKFELGSIKKGETVTITFIGYKPNVINDNTIDTKTGADTEYFLQPGGTKLSDVEVKAEKEMTFGCMDPKASNFDEVNSGDCKGKRAATYDVESGEATITLDSTDIDYSCCEYYEGCLDPKAENYWEKVSSFKKLKEEHPEKEIRACKNNKCCKYINGCMDVDAVNYMETATKDDGSCKAQTQGCIDPSALNYNANATKGCLDENKDGRPDCCKYPADQQGNLDTIKGNFADYYNGKIRSNTINIYEDENGRDERNPEELLGNYKVDNESPVPIMKGGNYIGFIIPLLPDSRAVKSLENKMDTNMSDKKRKKLIEKLKLLNSNDMGLTVTFGKNTKELLKWVFAAGEVIPPTLKTYLKPRGSNKKGKRVYVGPKAFTQKGLDKLIRFLKAYNLMNSKVPKTSSTEY